MTPLRSVVLVSIAFLLFALAGRGPLLAGHPAPLSEADRTAITAILMQQQTDWNRGDVPAFMEGYWKSSETTFAGSKGFMHGWETVRDRYKRDYPDKATMGQLEFSILEIRAIGADGALVLGKWRLARAADELGGIFTLLLQRFPQGWRIVHDHTTTTTAPHS